MLPKYWGRGAWVIIFTRIYYTISILNKNNYVKNIEKLKLILYLICTNLPCYTCSNEAKKKNANNIMSEMNINRILHFFIEFYNEFHENKIDRTKIKTYETYNIGN
ncbi:sulfhydryl oxidase FAD-linked (Cop-E10R) [Mythimna separata entomopoxvirus 'L']|uniref:Sulfhydryl oxidase FAD-linked (Cop-E10R) n=1 Tax=Mythimna separata entomopoxvirus 'L' TaxID=1293572 RepID=A0A916KQ97_9POXV|nr:sulfhydryl oxidase FAD-linked (Cop-E10R) [Mythimna separata entomopoxvirus 'L']CCU56368.1 sulfhydryl oxidase FAD-linked (Cop-E10R) [Mythimna separata entomopoxvirus 'L']